MKKSFTLGLVLTFFITSCASYTPQSVPKPKLESMVRSREEGGFAVGVDPYAEANKSEAAFGGDLKQAGILSLHVMVANRGQRRLAVRKSDFVLQLQDNKEFLPAPSTSVATRLESHAGVIGWSIAFGLIGFLASSSQQQQADNARRVDLRHKEFQDSTLGPGESADGFLFFLIPDDVKEIKDATLVARALDVADAASIRVPVPLDDMGGWNVQPQDQ